MTDTRSNRSDSRLDRAEKTLGIPPRAFLEPAPHGGRSRADLMWHEGRLGLRGKSGADGGWRFAPPDESWFRQLEPALPGLMTALVASNPPPGDIQVRFRVSPDGQRGLWLDLSRHGIDAMVSETDWLSRLIDDGWIIELGQRGEGVTSGPDGATPGREGLALQPAIPYPWLPAFSPQGEALPLECLVASFSQPGPLINRALTEAAGSLLDAEGIEEATWCDWGAGYGNLTAWCAGRLGPDGTALEADPRAFALLQGNATRFFPDVRLIHSRVEKIDIPPAADLWLIDPPRTGFATLLARLPNLRQPPRHLLAFHCHEVGLASDVAALRTALYRIQGWIAVDAFPDTDHLEVVSLWSAGRPAISLPGGSG